MLLCTYVLFCPVTGEIRYVGKSDRHLDKRVKEHLSEAKRKDLGRRGEWLRELIAQDLEPLIEHDVDIPDDVPWQKIERDRIAYYLSIGCDLVNGTAGGEGLRVDPLNKVGDGGLGCAALLVGERVSLQRRAARQLRFAQQLVDV